MKIVVGEDLITFKYSHSSITNSSSYIKEHFIYLLAKLAIIILTDYPLSVLANSEISDTHTHNPVLSMEATRAGCMQLKWSSLAVICSIFVLTGAQLNSQEKQQLLDLHNFYRSSVNAANMRRLVSMYLELMWLAIVNLQ